VKLISTRNTLGQISEIKYIFHYAGKQLHGIAALLLLLLLMMMLLVNFSKSVTCHASFVPKLYNVCEVIF